MQPGPSSGFCFTHVAICIHNKPPLTSLDTRSTGIYISCWTFAFKVSKLYEKLLDVYIYLSHSKDAWLDFSLYSREPRIVIDALVTVWALMILGTSLMWTPAHNGQLSSQVLPLLHSRNNNLHTLLTSTRVSVTVESPRIEFTELVVVMWHLIACETFVCIF